MFDNDLLRGRKSDQSRPREWSLVTNPARGNGHFFSLLSLVKGARVTSRGRWGV